MEATCSKHPDRVTEWHPCPYAIEINDAPDSEDHCTCCDECPKTAPMTSETNPPTVSSRGR